MQQQYGDRVQFVGVAGRSEMSAINDFIDTYSVGAFVHAFDDNGSVWREYGVVSQPSFAFVDADGNVEVEYGRHGVDELTARLDALL